MRQNLKIGILLFSATLTGLLIAWIDGLPGWDDTAILLGLLLIAAFCFSFAMPRYWLAWTVLTGIWIPLKSIVSNSDFSMLVLLLFPLFASLAGALLRRLVSPDSMVKQTN